MKKCLLVIIFTLLGCSGITGDKSEHSIPIQELANQGNANAQFLLGLSLSKKDSNFEDYSQVLFWHRKAADQGDAMSQYYLGAMYFLGKGIPKDYKLAYFWMLLSSAKGHDNAIKYRDIIEEQLSQQQRVEVQSDATNWKPTTITPIP